MAIIFGTTILQINCTDEEDITTFKSAYRNESGQPISIIGYNFNNGIEYDYSLENNNPSPECETPSPSFLGTGCNADSVVFKFSNNMGYICSSRFNNSPNLCFDDDKSPLGGTGKEIYYRKIEENSFEFIITEEDFENAFELPPDQ